MRKKYRMGRGFRSAATTLILFASVLAAEASAQWLNYPTPGVPRMADGKPNLGAPAPRTADGKLDLSGVWRGPGAGSYDRNVARDLKPGDVQPWAEALYQQRVRNMGKESPRASCLPDPFPYYHMVDLARFVQAPGLLVIMYQGTTNSVHRTVFTDGRKLPDDPNPAWMGYSVGHWEGDTLVVETTGFRDDVWLDVNGSPLTNKGKMTEKYRRPTFGKLDIDVTIEDPSVYTKPFTVAVHQQIMLNTDLIEFICSENEKSDAHLVGR
jgi:hypothetical protein